MNYLKTGLIGLVVGAGAAAVVLQRQESAELRQEIAAVRGEIQQLAQRREPVRSEAEKPLTVAEVLDSTRREDQAAELARLREEVAGLKTRTEQIVKAAQAAAAGNTDAVPAKLIPVSAWKNAGKATANAGLETALWAAVGGEVDTLTDSIAFTASARQKAEAFFAGLSESTRQQYGTPEKLMALMIAKDAAAISAMQVLGQREISPDDVGVKVRLANDKGGMKEQGFLMHQTPDGWRLMLPDDAVEKFAKQIGGAK